MTKEQEAWLTLPARQRAELAVSSNRRMGALFSHLMNAKLCNMSGSAYQCHPQCIYRDGILITDHWRTCGHWDIKIANDPKQTPRRGCQDSRSTGGDPYPSIDGGWTRVWDRGTWEKSGPWCEVILRVLETLTTEADEFYRRQAEEKEAARVAVAAKKAEEDAALLSAWSQR